MNMKTIAAAALAVCSASAFAAVTPSCPTAAPTTAGDLVTKCSPEITFYAAGATAMKGAIQAVLSTDGKVFDKSKAFATLALTGNADQYGYYGYGASTIPSIAGKRVLVIVNGKNGSMAGVNQLLSGLKAGSVVGTTDQKEFEGVMKLHTAAEQKAGTVMPAADVTVGDAAALSTTVTLAATRVVDFKTAWGVDKQKVAHMAFSDVRPSEAVPGQVKSWKPASFPAATVAMQGFGVVVNIPLYNALMARDVAAGRLPASCVADITPACQPTIFAADYVALMTGKITTANALLNTTGDTKSITLNRRPDSSGTQAATHIMFAGQAAYNAKLVDKATGNSLDGSLSELIKGGTIGTPFTSGDLTVTTHSGTSGLIEAVLGETTNYALGVASLDNASITKFGANAAAQTARWVKLNGFSPDANSTGTAFDSKQRAGLIAGYPFAMEFQVVKNTKLAGAYLAIFDAVKDGLKDPAANLTGIAYIGSTDAAKNTTWTRGENNYLPLNKY